jgi:lipopolysaccharide export system permease protein
MYFVKDICFAFLVSFLFFFAIFFINQILLMAQQILTKRVPLYQVALLLLYAMPQIIALSTPFAALMGILMTIGRMSSDNEILVILASGISYRMIFLPALIVGIVISIVSFLANDILLPAGQIQFRRLYRRIVVSTPALELEENTVKRFQDTTIITGPVVGTGISNIIILDRTTTGERRIIMARDAQLVDGGNEGLSLDLAHAFIHSAKEMVRDDYDYASSQFLRYWVPQDDLIQAITTITPDQMSSRDVRRYIETRTLAQRERLSTQHSKTLLEALNLEDSLRSGAANIAWNRRDRHLDAFTSEYRTAMAMGMDRTIQLYRVELNRKFSVPFGAFCFVFLAVSLGLTAKKSGQTMGFIFSIFISVAYWTMLMGGQTFAMRMGLSPFLSLWMKNILALSIGLVLFLRRIRK